MNQKLKIAICQHPISSDIKANLVFIIEQISIAKGQNADIAHFPECNLSSYAGVDFDNVLDQDSELLKVSINQIQNKARESKIWVIFGSHHFQNKNKKPFNSLFLINDKGDIVERYDKRLLAGLNGDLDNYHYKKGESAVTFFIKGIKCALLICHEWRYPELYREYKFQDVQLIFQSFYDGKLSDEEYKKDNGEQGELVVGTMKGNAANNYLWISISNTPDKESCFPGLLIKPNGHIVAKLKRNKTGVLIHEIDFDEKFEDPSQLNRTKIKRDIYGK